MCPFFVDKLNLDRKGLLFKLRPSCCRYLGLMVQSVHGGLQTSFFLLVCFLHRVNFLERLLSRTCRVRDNYCSPKIGAHFFCIRNLFP